MSEICENCGHDELVHSLYTHLCYGGNNCSCKKFKPQNYIGNSTDIPQKAITEQVYEDVWYPEKDVKEAVQKLKRFFTSSGDYSKECIQEEIDKIFGKKLT